MKRPSTAGNHPGAVDVIDPLLSHARHRSSDGEKEKEKEKEKDKDREKENVRFVANCAGCCLYGY
jgi:hypothetical protein